jgi:subtilisin family serine protease
MAVPLRALAAFVLLALLASGCSSSQPTASTDAAPPPTEEAEAPANAPEAPANAPERVPPATQAEDPTPADRPPATDDPAAAAANAPQDWHLRATGADSIEGIGVIPTYDELVQEREPERTVVVAVIDGGVDIAHEDLDDVLWTNEGEIPDNGQDDDGNGYVDDVHGWNFIGGPDGQNVDHDTFEVTRIVARLRPIYENVDPDTLTAEEEATYARYQALSDTVEAKRRSFREQLPNIRMGAQVYRQANRMLMDELGTQTLTAEAVRGAPDTGNLGQAKQVWLYFDELGASPEDLDDYEEYLSDGLEYGYNLDFDPRPIVGDDYDDLDQRIYGNPDVTGPDAEHGTIVAGIVAAERGNGLGADGVAPARIMAIRAVPNGDERDKDVANAIRYAVDNGAHVINMSFGKGYSPQKEAVDAAVRYADERGVLLVHAAGNDAENIDEEPNFPSDAYADGGRAQNWIEVGASSAVREELSASFSNYGDETVDLFAPGVEIYAPHPGQRYDRADGTSMAAPVVSGVAALLMAYFPDLSAADVKQILLETVTRYEGVEVATPTGGQPDGSTVDFCTLSATCGVVNAYRAFARAAEMTGTSRR